MRTIQNQAPQRPSGLPPVRGVGQAALDIRTIPNRDLCERFERAMRSAHEARLAGIRTDHWSREANTIWRELKLRLVPTNPDGTRRS